jgi:hypothetical protein
MQQFQLIAGTLAPLPFDLWSLTGKPVATSTGLDFEAFLRMEPRGRSLALTSLKLAPFFGFVSLPGALPPRRCPGLPWAIHSWR